MAQLLAIEARRYASGMPSDDPDCDRFGLIAVPQFPAQDVYRRSFWQHLGTLPDSLYAGGPPRLGWPMR